MKSLFKLLAAFAVASFSTVVSAHCDTLDGPVITAAKKSIETKNPNHFLIWVKKKDAATVTSQFEKTLSDKRENPERANEIDTAFFETLVRIHREGEGAPYDGLKATDEDEIVALADAAIDSGSWTALKARILSAVGTRFDERFAELMGKKGFPTDDVGAGREYVETYVPFLHWTEAFFVDAKPGHASEESHHEAPDGEAAHLAILAGLLGMLLGGAGAFAATRIPRKKKGA